VVMVMVKKGKGYYTLGNNLITEARA